MFAWLEKTAVATDGMTIYGSMKNIPSKLFPLLI